MYELTLADAVCRRRGDPPMAKKPRALQAVAPAPAESSQPSASVSELSQAPASASQAPPEGARPDSFDLEGPAREQAVALFREDTACGKQAEALSLAIYRLQRQLDGFNGRRVELQAELRKRLEDALDQRGVPRSAHGNWKFDLDHMRFTRQAQSG
jgi:hypothetical protein